MPVRIQEMSDGSYVCSNHLDKKVALKLASVAFPAGCDECTRAAFVESLEQALLKIREAANQNR
jgi:hypothetical protein